MHCPLPIAILSAALSACGGKVIFDTGSAGTGGAPTSSTHGATTSKTSSAIAVSATTNNGVVGSNVSTTDSGGNCKDPGAPAGTSLGATDCSQQPCSAASTCFEVCSALYDCGLAKCGPGGTKLCPGFGNNAGAHDSFITAPGGCAQNCMMTPALKQITDPTDCVATINMLKAAAAPFKQLCEGGPGG
jgi:hypothetical protein